MVFSSIIFLSAFLPLTLVLYYIPFSIKYKNAVLIIMSLLFYSFGEPLYIFLMIGSVIMNYIFGVCLGKNEKNRRLTLGLSVIFNLVLLGVFKYAGFFVTTVNNAFGLAMHVPKISLPIGISFYTFQAMSYVIDVYRDKNQVQRNFFKLLLYISFFPQLIAGPIVRYHDIDKQLTARGKNGAADPEMIMAGIKRFIKGLAKKVIIANAMGQIADTIYALDISGYNALTVWLGALSYVFQIYYDFSGYSDMAIGLAKMFGFEFLENFEHPYSSLSVKEFWRRWHISLSTWFKEYVYIPLGGNRKGKARTRINKIIVFFLTGFWHGANWTFIIWGLFHGVFLTIEDIISDIRGNKKAAGVLFKVIKNVYVWLVVTVGFVFFRADNISYALRFIGKMFTGFNGDRASLGVVMRLLNPYNVFIFALAFVLSYPVSIAFSKSLNKKKIYNVLTAVGSLCLLGLCILNFASEAYNPFIYFRF